MSHVPIFLAQWTVNPGSGIALAPRWGWYVILYFFIGGLAAGTFVIATLLDIVGDRRDRDTVHLGYRLAFPLLLLSGVLLVLDLGKPFRFWHMLVQSNRFPLPIYKGWSAISIGSWILTLFGLFAFVAWLNTMSDEGRLRDGWRSRLAPLTPITHALRVSSSGFGLIWGILGVLAGFGLGGYTGVLVTDTSIPFWHNSRPMGALFLVSALSTSYALLMLILMRRGRAHTDPSVAKLATADVWAIVFEIVVLATLLVSLGTVGRPVLVGGFGAVFWIGVVGVGLLAPLVLHMATRQAADPDRRSRTSAVCVLVGGFLLRVVIVMAPQWPATGLFTL
ncbi:MAG: polysulfide reductase NrfD [Gemmatimonadaceae bacterium]